MKNTTVLLLLLAGAIAPAAAQPAPKNDPKLETVIVTAPRLHAGVTPNAIAHDFVKSFATPKVLGVGIARWQTAICPDFEGLAPQYMAVMEARFHTIADRAGAPMKEKGCRRNLRVYFTPQPQAVLDSIHARNVEALGYRGTTKVTHPIQAWYVTATTGIGGQQHLDEDRDATVECHFGFCGLASTSSAYMSDVGGWRFHPDATSDLIYVTIIVDSQKTATFRVGEIADLVAMLALSRTDDYEDCQLMPSITNLLSSNCDDKQKPSEITATDIAYLRGVYKMDAGAKLQIQQDQIAGEMAKVLAGGK
jgi:hypothetical protein